MKNNKGITLIALIVTIIVLIILAGVAIAMLRGDNGILNRASEAKYENSIGAFDEQVRLAQMALRTNITANMVNAGTEGYIATLQTNKDVTPNTTPNNFTKLVNEVRKDLGVAENDTGFKTENFSVVGYLDVEGSASVDGEGYILITYTDNALRSSLPKGTVADNANTAENVAKWRCNGIDFIVPGEKIASANQAVLAYVIKVTNYKCELSNAILTDSTTVNGSGDFGKASFDVTTVKNAVTKAGSVGWTIKAASSPAKV